MSDRAARLGLRAGGVLTSLSVLALFGASPAQAHPVSGVFVVPRALNGPSVTAPASANLGSAKPGGSVSVHLGTVTVSNSGQTAWTATVSATNLRTGAGTTAETITNGRLSYWSGPVVTKSGNGTFTPGQPTAAGAVTLNTPRTAFSYSGFTMSTSVTFNPTLIVSVPATAVTGTYTGTVTHSVA